MSRQPAGDLGPALPAEQRSCSSNSSAHGASRTPEFMTLTPKAPGGPRGERDAVIGRQGLREVAYAAIGRAARLGLLAFVFCPVLTRPGRLGLQSRLSLPRRNRSSPFCPLLYHRRSAISSHYRHSGSAFCPADGGMSISAAQRSCRACSTSFPICAIRSWMLGNRRSARNLATNPITRSQP